MDQYLVDGWCFVGCKIGLIFVVVQKQFGVDQLDFGMLFDYMGYGDGEFILVEIFIQLKIEVEIVFVIGCDIVVSDLGYVDVFGVIEYVLLVFEIVGSCIVDWDICIVDMIVDNVLLCVYVLGFCLCQLLGIDLCFCGMVMEWCGEFVLVGVGVVCLGNLFNVVVWFV